MWGWIRSKIRCYGSYGSEHAGKNEFLVEGRDGQSHTTTAREAEVKVLNFGRALGIIQVYLQINIFQQISDAECVIYVSS